MLKEQCCHPEYALTPGANMPLVYGSMRTQVCTLCGSWRAHSHIAPPDATPSNRWRPDYEYEDSVKEVEVY